MDIRLIPAGNGSKFTFPALPEKIQGKYITKYQSFDIISQGTVKVPKGTDVAEFSWNGVSVSYTHLDVYKRQLIKTGSQKKHFRKSCQSTVSRMTKEG